MTFENNIFIDQIALESYDSLSFILHPDFFPKQLSKYASSKKGDPLFDVVTYLKCNPVCLFGESIIN